MKTPKNITPSKQFQDLMESPRSRVKIDTLNTHIHDHSLLWAW